MQPIVRLPGAAGGEGHRAAAAVQRHRLRGRRQGLCFSHSADGCHGHGRKREAAGYRHPG